MTSLKKQSKLFFTKKKKKEPKNKIWSNFFIEIKTNSKKKINQQNELETIIIISPSKQWQSAFAST